MTNSLPTLNTIQDLQLWKEYILTGNVLSRENANQLLNITADNPLFETFLNSADVIRRHFLGNTIELCSIINAKSGRCSEDCKFCAQSAHYDTPVETYALLDYAPIETMAKENETAGVHRFSLVMSGRGINAEELDVVLQHYQRLQKETQLSLCASLGIMTETHLKQLADVGITMYHHNLESGRHFYETVCSTHTYDERIETIHAAQRAGLKICSGGIIGMGETWSDRLDLIFELRTLQVASIPINILNPILGTPFERVPKLSQSEILKTIALFRWVHPTADIRLGGGRHLIDDAGKSAFLSGASATITGNYLTTVGQDMAGDQTMLAALNLPLGIRR